MEKIHVLTRKGTLDAIVVAVGSFLVYFSIRPTMGFDQIYFYWSFTYVDPLSRLNLTPGLPYNLPVILRTYEVLLPWFIAGLVLVFIGFFLLYNRYSKSLKQLEKTES